MLWIKGVRNLDDHVPASEARRSPIGSAMRNVTGSNHPRGYASR